MKPFLKHASKLKLTPFSRLNSTHTGAVYLGIYLALVPVLARADVVDTLNNFMGYLTGGLGKAVAGLAIVAVGFGCFALGKVPKGYVIAVVVGVGIIFGAKAILGMLTG